MTNLTPLGLRLSRYHAAGGWDAVAREVERMQASAQQAAKALLADVRRRYPSTALRCEYMIALDAAVTAAESRT